MTFLNPLVLLALAAAAIPLVIHLFNFRRPRRVDFSSLAFLEEVQRSTMQRVRIKQWLLLAVRTLIIACLVLAFARPSLQGNLAGALGGEARSSVVVAVDNSLSMTLRDADGAYLEQARRLARGIIEQAQPGDELFVLTTGDAGAEPAAYESRRLALDALDDVAPAPVTTPLAQMLQRGAEALREAGNPNREIYLISDAQRSTLLDTQRVVLPEGTRSFLLPVGRRSHANVAVTNVRVVSRIVELGQPARVEATLENYGTEPLEQYTASVFLEEERVAQATADLAPGVPTTVRFTVTPRQRGWLAGTVEIEDDGFEQDNLRYFTLHVPERRRLLLVQGSGQRTDYVELALSSRLTQGRTVFDVQTVDEQALAATALGSYDAVVLVGPRDLSSGEVAAIARYAEGGGGVLVFPNASMQATDYNALFRELGAGRFAGFSGTVGQARRVATFDQVDLEHPLFSGVFDETGAEREARVESPELYAVAEYVPGTGAEQTLVSLSNGRPFLQEIRRQRGAVLLMTTAPDPRWSDLPLRGVFIPLLYRSVYYLSSDEPVQGNQFLVGQAEELRLLGARGEEPLRLVAPDGEEFVPEQRILFGAALLRLDDEGTRTPGVYDVRAGEALVRRVAFNLSGAESDLRAYAGPEAAEQLSRVTEGSVQLLEAGSGRPEALARAVQQERAGVELWNVFLMAALVLLVIEMLIARRWRPEAAPA